MSWSEDAADDEGGMDPDAWEEPWGGLVLAAFAAFLSALDRLPKKDDIT